MRRPCAGKKQIDTIVLAGKTVVESVIDWAAKGANLLGVKVVLAESFERIHRSIWSWWGFFLLRYLEGENAVV